MNNIEQYESLNCTKILHFVRVSDLIGEKKTEKTEMNPSCRKSGEMKNL